jgi:hypothetical protein
MLRELLTGEHCRWCGRDLGSFSLTRLTSGIEKAGAMFYPVLCLCGGITVVGASTFVSHIDDFAEPVRADTGRGSPQSK